MLSSKNLLKNLNATIGFSLATMSLGDQSSFAAEKESKPSGNSITTEVSSLKNLRPPTDISSQKLSVTWSLSNALSTAGHPFSFDLATYVGEDGNLYVTGRAGTSSTLSTPHLVKINKLSGKPDWKCNLSDLNPKTSSDNIESIVLDKDGRVIIASSFKDQNQDGINSIRISILDGKSGKILKQEALPTSTISAKTSEDYTLCDRTSIGISGNFILVNSGSRLIKLDSSNLQYIKSSSISVEGLVLSNKIANGVCLWLTQKKNEAGENTKTAYYSLAGAKPSEIKYDRTKVSLEGALVDNSRVGAIFTQIGNAKRWYCEMSTKTKAWSKPIILEGSSIETAAEISVVGISEGKALVAPYGTGAKPSLLLASNGEIREVSLFKTPGDFIFEQLDNSNTLIVTRPQPNTSPSISVSLYCTNSRSFLNKEFKIPLSEQMGYVDTIDCKRISNNEALIKIVDQKVGNSLFLVRLGENSVLRASR